jgi:hypothetical protein
VPIPSIFGRVHRIAKIATVIAKTGAVASLAALPAVAWRMIHRLYLDFANLRLDLWRAWRLPVWVCLGEMLKPIRSPTKAAHAIGVILVYIAGALPGLVGSGASLVTETPPSALMVSKSDGNQVSAGFAIFRNMGHVLSSGGAGSGIQWVNGAAFITEPWLSVSVQP